MEDIVRAFEYEGREVRFVGTADKPEWVAADVLNVLHPDLNKTDRSNLLRKITQEWKGMKRIHTPGGMQNATTLYEPGLYQLLARSNSELAVPFQKWLFEEVLPSIRKTGSYGNPAPSHPSETLESVKDFAAFAKEFLAEDGILEHRDKILINDFLRSRLGLSAQSTQLVNIVERAVELGYPRPKRGEDSQLGKAVAQLYRFETGRDPHKHQQFVDGRMCMVNTYTTDDLPILDNAIPCADAGLITRQTGYGTPGVKASPLPWLALTCTDTG